MNIGWYVRDSNTAPRKVELTGLPPHEARRIDTAASVRFLDGRFGWEWVHRSDIYPSFHEAVRARRAKARATMQRNIKSIEHMADIIAKCEEDLASPDA